MKKLLIIAALLAVSFQLSAQKIGYMNTETILSKIPSYTAAKEKLDALNSQYKAKVESEYKVIEQMYNKYQSSKASLNEYQRSQKENEIINKEKAAKELQKSYFGQDGYMQKKTDELLSPIKERVQNAINQLAKQEGYSLIIDLAAAQGIIYNNKQQDLSQKIINMLK
jgi:outer membrane protein